MYSVGGLYPPVLGEPVGIDPFPLFIYEVLVNKGHRPVVALRKVKAGYGQHLGLIAAAGVVGGGYPL